ncbi:MAG: single-stranded DNA-binding protein [Lysobacteraceae bacterium]|nr:MAG: single-stranded DNA-binding protein [Xanthomonadaceae bacterium]
MASVNKVILVGNLGRDPEVRTFPSGGQVCNVSIATTEKWRDKSSGETREQTEWHNLVFNDRLAEIAGQYLKKGSQIYVEGQIRSRKYQDKDGVERTAYEVRVRELQLLGGRQGMGGPGGNDDGGGYDDAPAPRRAPAPAPRAAAPAPAQRQAPAKSSSGFDDMDDDIPF